MADFIRGADRELVRDYITAADHMQYSQLPSDVVAILLTHSNLSASHPDIRINLHTTVSAVQLLMIFITIKFRLEMSKKNSAPTLEPLSSTSDSF
jgi:hypothetical protein